ncbi:MAG: ribonuclease P protein component [Spirochaetes bacterium]|nr:ribonuclease P protein component [Spirochaetota bacterium]
MKRRYSLKGLKRFREVIANGTRLYYKGIRMIVYKQPLLAGSELNSKVHSHFAIVVNRNYGNAVERNKVKRKIRSIVVTLMPRIRQGFAVIIFPDATCKSKGFNNLLESVTHLLLKSGVLKQ